MIMFMLSDTAGVLRAAPGSAALLPPGVGLPVPQGSSDPVQLQPGPSLRGEAGDEKQLGEKLPGKGLRCSGNAFKLRSSAWLLV